MHSASDENKLKPCLTRMIDTISQCIQNLKNHKRGSGATTTDQSPPDNLDDDDVSASDQLNPNVNIFTLDKVENDLLNQLTEDIETILDDCLPYLTDICSTSFNDYLHQYHYDGEERKFAYPLTKNVLLMMRRELKGLLGKRTSYLAFN